LESLCSSTLIGEKRHRIDASIKARLWEKTSPSQNLQEAMAYSLEAPGKRIRALLCLGCYEIFGGKYSAVEPFLVALEMIHAYSLIHDDLPAMDDSQMRRGKPTNHRQYGEAMAILAGDALLTDAFVLMTESDLGADKVLLATRRIARSAGSWGMVAGQALDVSISPTHDSIHEIEQMQRLKTGELITTAVVVGGILGGANSRELSLLEAFGQKMGQAFQMADDLLDLERMENSGKDSGIDYKNQKPTMLFLLGLEKTKLRCQELVGEASQNIISLERPCEFMLALAKTMIERSH
jgi:geranylgeranyl diphosphate synthase type II